MSELKRTLSLTEVIIFGVGSVLGAGIYALIGKMAGYSGNMLWLAFAIAAITALLSAFSYAELSAAYPQSGGEYIYAQKAFGKKTGVFIGSIVSFNGIITGATVSIGFAGYLSLFLNAPQLIMAIAILVLIFFVNVTGIRQSSIVNIIFTIIEIGGLLFVIYCSLPSIGKVNYLEAPPAGFNGLLTASALSFFAYLGFEKIVKLGEETVNPEKAIPKALFISAGIVTILYMAIAICSVSMVPFEELSNSESPLADVVSIRFSRTGAVVISVIALFSTSNTILVGMLGSSRVILSMAKENKFLKQFAVISTKRKTPVKALLLVLLVTCAFALIGEIEIVAFIANFFIFLTFITVNSSAIILRIKDKDLKRPFRIPGNIKNIPVISVLGILLTLFLLIYTVYGLINGTVM